MVYLERAIKFTIKHYLILVPMLAAAVIVSLASRTGSTSLLNQWQSISGALTNGDVGFEDIGPTLQVLSSAALGGGILATVFTFVTQPMTAGLIKKGLTEKQVNFDDFMPAFSENIVKYLMFFIGRFVLIAVLTLIGILGLIVVIMLAFALGEAGSVLVLIGVLALVAVIFIISVLMSFWFAAMVLDDLDVIDGLKRSIKVAKKCFWTLFFISILISIVAGIVGLIFNIFAFIPLLGAILIALGPTIGSVLQIVFAFDLYQDKKQLVI